MKILFASLVLAAAASSALAGAAPPPSDTQHAVDSAAVRLQRIDGKWVKLDAELEGAGQVALNFVFTSCSAICPIQSRVFAELQAKAGPGLRLVSISIDPLNDTPERLRDYARKIGAGSGWRFYTGTLESSAAAERAFDVYRGNKMNHAPVTFLRARAGAPWQRVDGYASADQLLAALRR
ncbi:MAG: SCO family protein [Telluria sp.]